ncbi:hypothetical protein [Sorangium sp. So ce1151]|uniref:hypothetical protein n=1 Tax=Sorangium sp. So ce1151 TaxID=3133332 RepID=UPI003F62F9BF
MIVFARGGGVRALAMLSAVSALAGCMVDVSADDEVRAREGVDSTGQHLLRTGAPWPGGRVPVCYLLPEGLTAAARRASLDYWARTRRAIEASWERAAKIDFHGWGPCGASTGGWLAVTLDRGTWSSSDIGYAGASQATRMMLDMNDKREPVVQIHEFGHVLGFAHEFDRRGWSPGRACTTCRSDDDCDSGGREVCLDTGYCSVAHATYDEVTAADEDSIMAATYCDNWADEHGRLSSWDIVGAQRVYGVRPAQGDGGGP